MKQKDCSKEKASSQKFELKVHRASIRVSVLGAYLPDCDVDDLQSIRSSESSLSTIRNGLNKIIE